MTQHENDFMQRYIYQVVRRIPKEQREEVRMELEELISDMYADKGCMEEVLRELGDPAEFAKQYQGAQKYLIGPEYFDTYLWFTKVVLICAAVPIFATSLIDAIGQIVLLSEQNSVHSIVQAIGDGMADGVVNALLGVVSAFGIITFIFAVMERQQVRIDMQKAEKWSVEKLSQESKVLKSRWTPSFLEPVPDKRAIISRGDNIVGIVFTVIFGILLIFAPDFFAAIIPNGNKVTLVPIFNLQQWETILPVFILSLLISMADEILQLITGVYCKLVMVSNIFAGVLQIVLASILFKRIPIWNPDFLPSVHAALGEGSASMGTLFSRWNAQVVSNGIFALIIIIVFAEVGVTIYKTLRYGTRIVSSRLTGEVR